MKTHNRNEAALEKLQQDLGHRFVRREWLQQALTHRSFSAQNNERLEFIGDSILDYAVAKMLYEAFPSLPEGKLSRLRSNLVNQDTLAEIAAELNLGAVLNLGVGELKSGGSSRPSILADALEALFAAVSFDADFAAAEQTVRRLFAERIRRVDPNVQAKDAKTQLQEALQARRYAVPRYRIEKQTGEGNQAVFDVSCDLGELGHISYAGANSRRAAEQIAAQQALQWLEAHFAAAGAQKKRGK